MRSPPPACPAAPPVAGRGRQRGTAAVAACGAPLSSSRGAWHALPPPWPAATHIPSTRHVCFAHTRETASRHTSRVTHRLSMLLRTRCHWMMKTWRTSQVGVRKCSMNQAVARRRGRVVPLQLNGATHHPCSCCHHTAATPTHKQTEGYSDDDSDGQPGSSSEDGGDGGSSSSGDDDDDDEPGAGRRQQQQRRPLGRGPGSGGAAAAAAGGGSKKQQQQRPARQRRGGRQVELEYEEERQGPVAAQQRH